MPWDQGRDLFAATPDITGEQLYAHMCGLAEQAGWIFGCHIAGHTVGLTCHWILEVHLVDRDRTFGGYFEQLLDIGPNARPGPA